MICVWVIHVYLYPGSEKPNIIIQHRWLLHFVAKKAQKQIIKNVTNYHHHMTILPNLIWYENMKASSSAMSNSIFTSATIVAKNIAVRHNSNNIALKPYKISKSWSLGVVKCKKCLSLANKTIFLTERCENISFFLEHPSIELFQNKVIY